MKRFAGTALLSLLFWGSVGFSVFAKAPQSSPSTTTLAAGFTALHATSVWPLPLVTRDAMESTFGPRLKDSTDSYDWHRGVDIDAPLGSPVVAAADGVLWDVTTYENGGLTVILQHTFPQLVVFHGVTTSTFYTFSMHLASVEPSLEQAAQMGEHPVVKAGQSIGTVGHSGTAIGDHLHFEIRVGTWCTLEYQLANPSSSCAQGFGFDPAVHPLFLFSPFSDNMTLVRVADGVRLTLSDQAPDVNRVEVKITDKKTHRVLRDAILDLNERTGFDATSTAALDTPDTTKPYFSPQDFGASSSAFETVVVIPASFLPTEGSGRYLTTLTASSIWGGTQSLSW